MPPHPTLYLKKNVYKKIGGFNLNYNISSDYDFIIRLFKDRSLKLRHLPRFTIKMQTGGTSNKNLKNIIKKSVEDLKILKKNKIGGKRVLFKKNISKLPQLFLKPNN
jgi:glycosyltransferase